MTKTCIIFSIADDGRETPVLVMPAGTQQPYLLSQMASMVCDDPKRAVIDGYTVSGPHGTMVGRMVDTYAKRPKTPTRGALSAADAVAIRHRVVHGGETATEVAARYGVSRQAISQVVNGNTHPQAGGPTRERGIAGRRGVGKKDRDSMLAALDGGDSVRRVAAAHGVSTTFVYTLRRGGVR